MKDGGTDAKETMCPVTELAGPRLWNSRHSQGLSVKHRQQHLIKIKLDTKGELEKHKIQLSRFKIQYKKGDIHDRKTEKVLWVGRHGIKEGVRTVEWGDKSKICIKMS